MIALVMAALVEPGPWLARLVEVPLAVHTPDVRIPGVVIEKPSAVIVAGGVDRATLTIHGLSWEARSLLSLEIILQVGAVVFLAWVIRRLARNIQAGEPFARLSRPLVQAAAVLFGGGFLWSIAGGIGAYLAGREALEIHGWSAPDSVVGGLADSTTALSYLGWPEPADWSVSFTLLPFAVAIVLALLGLAFRTGERLQADTEGLI